MRRFCVSAFVFGLLILAVGTFAASSSDVERGRVLLAKGDSWGALQTLSVCLNQPLETEDRHIECLYLGEKAADKVMKLINRSGCRNDDLERFRRFGLKAETQQHYGSYCVHSREFFQTLRKRYPNSIYRPEVEYTFVGGCDVYVPQGWKQCEQSKIRYIMNFLDAEYVVVAKLRLAQLYDNLWEHLTDPQGPLDLVGTGDAEKDRTLAEESRFKALILYLDVLRSRSIHIDNDEYRMAAARYVDLRARISGGVFYELSIH